MGKVVGIDLGTTNSLVAYVDESRPVVIRDESGDALVPSVVSIGEDGTIFVGREAQRRLLTAPSIVENLSGSSAALLIIEFVTNAAPRNAGS